MRRARAGDAWVAEALDAKRPAGTEQGLIKQERCEKSVGSGPLAIRRVAFRTSPRIYVEEVVVPRYRLISRVGGAALTRILGDTMTIEDLYRLLRAGHVQAQGVVDTVPDPLLVLDESLCIQAASRSFFQTFKVDRYETIGKHVYELGNGQWDIPGLRLLLTEVIPKSTAVINYQVEHDFPDLGRRTMHLTARTLFRPDGGSRLLLLSIVDVTDVVKQDAAKDLLFGELQHRMKNLLSVVRSLIGQTSTEGRSAEEYRDAFLGRFDALVEAENLAFSEQAETGVRVLVERILAPYAAEREAIILDDGAAVELSPRAVRSLGLVLHELATNAAKYGALSVPEGQVNVSWRLEDEGRDLRLEWTESGGPPVAPPDREGYGSKLIRSATTYSLGGEVEQEYAASGLRTSIVVPLG